MSRLSLTIIVLILAGGYLVSLAWFGSKFISYARWNDNLSLQKNQTQRATIGKVVTLELQGSGFDKSTQVQMQMEVNNQDAIVATLPLEGLANDMLLEGNQIYLATADSGLQVFDIRNPTSPELISTYLARYPILDIEKSGSYYFFSCAAQGIYIYQKSADGQLKLIHRLHSLGAAVESRVVGSFLYVAAGRRGLQVYDLGNTEEDRPIRVMDTGGVATGIEVYEDRLYLTTNSASVQVFQIKEPGKPLYVGKIPVDEKVRDVKRYQDKLYLLENNKVSLYQLGKPLLPELLDSQVLLGNSKYLHLVDETLYASDTHSGITQIDISQSGRSKANGFIDVGGSPRPLVSKGQYLYVAVSGVGIRIIDKRAILPRQVAMSIETSGFVNDLIIKDRWLYISDLKNDSRLINLDQKGKPSVPFGKGNSRSFTVLGNLLYAAKGQDGVVVFSIEDPAAPKSVAYWPELKPASDLGRIGQYLVLAKGSGGLVLADISDFSQPVVTDSIAGIHAAKTVVADDLVFVAEGKSGVSILKISAQGRFEQVGKVVSPFPLNGFSEAYDIKVKEGIAYIANGRGGLLIADVQNPRQPQIISSVGLSGNAVSLVLEGDRAYVSCRKVGVQIVDVSNLKYPQIVSSIGIYGLTSGIQVVDGMIYLANGYSGVTAIPVPQQVNNFEVISSEKISVKLPSPKIPGRYSLQISKQGQSAVLSGVVEYTAEL